MAENRKNNKTGKRILYLLMVVNIITLFSTGIDIGKVKDSCHSVTTKQFHLGTEILFSPLNRHDRNSLVHSIPTYDNKHYELHTPTYGALIFNYKKETFLKLLVPVITEQKNHKMGRSTTGRGMANGGRGTKIREGPGRRWPEKKLEASQKILSFANTDSATSISSGTAKMINALPTVTPEETRLEPIIHTQTPKVLFATTPSTTSKPIGPPPIVSHGDTTAGEAKRPDNTKAPVMTSLSKEPAKTQDKLTTTYVTRVQYRKRVQSSPNVIELMTNLAACLMQYNRSIQLVPYDDTDNSNAIITPRDIPKDVNEFAIYVPSASVSKRNTLFMKFKITSNMSLYKLKKEKGIMNFLERCSIYLDQMYLKSSDTVKMGGFILSHCQYTRIEQAMEEMNARLNQDESLPIEIQLSPHHYWQGTGGNRVSTRVLAIECARTDTNEVRERIYRKLMQIPDRFKYGNTRDFRFIPFAATGTMTDDALRNSVMHQNSFLLGLTDVQIKKIKNFDWMVPNDVVTFRERVLEANKNSGIGKLFVNVEIANGIGKMHLTTSKSNLNEAQEWVDTFIAELEELRLDPEEWVAKTSYPEVFQRVDQRATSDAEKAYSSHLISALNIGGSVQATMGPITAPRKNAWTQNRVLYGTSELEKKSTIQTQEKTISTMSNTHTPQGMTAEDIKSHIAELNATSVEERKKEKEDFLEEVRALNKSSDVRLQSLETLGEHNEEIKAEMLLSTKKCFQEINKQYSSIVEINNRMTVSETKFDKLQNTMSIFMTRMAETVNRIAPPATQETNTSMSVDDLTDFLDADEMDIDSVLGKRKPLSAAIDGLRDRGIRK